MTFFRKMIKNSKGATAIEYGLIAALIAVAAISAMSDPRPARIECSSKTTNVLFSWQS